MMDHDDMKNAEPSVEDKIVGFNDWLEDYNKMEENGVGNSKLLERNDEKPKMEIAFCSISSINFEAKRV